MESSSASSASASSHASVAERSDGEEFVVIIDPAARQRWFDFPQLWQFRELIWVLAARDIKVRYKQTVIGVAWAILQPAAMMAVLVWFFMTLGRAPIAENAPYPYAMTLLCGLLTWQLFANGLKGASESLLQHQDMLKKIYFPRVILPLVAIITALVDFAISLLLLVGLAAYYRIVPGPAILLLPWFVLLAAATAFAFGLWFSAMTAMYRDLRHVIPVLIQVWFFVSPVIYESTLVPARYRALYALNPMVGAIDGFRWALLGAAQPPLMVVAISTVSVAVILFGGIAYFRKMEREFADRI